MLLNSISNSQNIPSQLAEDSQQYIYIYIYKERERVRSIDLHISY